MDLDRRTFTAGLAGTVFFTAFAGASRAQQLEKPSLRLGVGNKPHLYYLPLTLADRRGYFKDYGLDVSIIDFEGGAQALDALIGGALDVVTGAYEHTLRMQAKGQDVRALIELGRFPGIVLAVRKDRRYNSPADLKGMKIGVTAPDSSTHFFVLYLMAKAGLTPTDASFVGVGGGPSAIAAMESGELDAMANLDPIITKLQQDGAIRLVADTRFPRVNYQIFGGTNPAAVLYAKQDFIAANPNTIQALVNAFYKTLKWIATATTDEIVNTVPQEYFFGDRDIYVKALRANLLVYSKDRHDHACGHEKRARHAGDLRSGAQERRHQPAKNIRRSIREAGNGSIRRSKRRQPGERRSKTRDRSPVDAGLTRFAASCEGRQTIKNEVQTIRMWR
jgi:NitT/TauT family transport system substrate-binding protein